METTRPKPPPVISKNVPAMLRALPRWVVWRYEWRGGKWAKPPRQIDGRYAESNNPDTWAEYPEALKAAQTGEFDGVGIVLPPGMVGIDLDDCLSPEGLPNELARMVGAMFPTYCEISPSGRGLKFLAAGNLDPKLAKISKAKGVEIYDGGATNRYFTVTGNLFGPAKTITGQGPSLIALQSIITDPPTQLGPELDRGLAAEKALALIQFIPADLADSYDTWLAVGMALNWCSTSPDLLQAWLDWSIASPKFDSDICEAKWESFTRESGRLVTLSYLEKLAAANGYDPTKYQTQSINAVDLLQKIIVRDYFVEDFMVAREPMIIGGASKALKTSVALELALSLATGTPFLQKFQVKAPLSVLFLSGESGEATLQESLQAMIGAKNFTPAQADQIGNLNFSFKLPKLNNPKMVDELVAELKAKEIGIVFLDPLYRSLSVGDQASNIYSMGEQLEWIAEKIHRAGISIILLHHFRKQGKSTDPPELEDLSQSGIAEFGRQFLLLKRKERYQHDGKHSLWFTWGGSAGHQGEAVLEVYTGTRKIGLTWQTTLQSPQEWEANQADQQKVDKVTEADETRTRLLEVMGANPGLNTRELCAEVGGKRAKILALLEVLLASGTVTLETRKRGSKHYFLGG